MVRILVGGDVYPHGKVQGAFASGDAQEIFNDMLEEIRGADLSVANLECPLISKKTPIMKAGPVLGAGTDCVHGFSASKWNLINLANNHIFDHGAQGLEETIRAIRDAGMNVIGAGMNIDEAQAPFIQIINGKRIVIYSMAEREFAIADRDTPGANPLDVIRCVNAIRLYKQQGIFIVIIHGGKEYYEYPSPEAVRRCRFLVEMGADAVICCHTHCPLPWEIYADRPIVYGLGNLIFEAERKQLDSWYEGYMVCLTVEGAEIRLTVTPYMQSSMGTGARKMDDVERKKFFGNMEERNSRIQDEVFLEERWRRYCQQQKDAYLAGLFGYNRFMRILRKLLLPRLHPRKARLEALHLVQCETHQEVLNTIFTDERKQMK